LCGSGMKEGWALGEGGLQLLLADLERPHECGAGLKYRRFNTNVKATQQLSTLAAAGADEGEGKGAQSLKGWMGHVPACCIKSSSRVSSALLRVSSALLFGLATAHCW